MIKAETVMIKRRRLCGYVSRIGFEDRGGKLMFFIVYNV